jgi:histidinol phosphatase-like PHP family hydrolase
MLFNNIEKSKRRRNRAESKGKLSFAHYRGDLHVHTKDDPGEIARIARERIGSDCGKHTANEILMCKLVVMNNEFVAITNHSRNGAPNYGLVKVEAWLTDCNVFANKQDIIENARLLILYQDERLMKNIDQIEKERKKFKKKKIINGIEANVLSDGQFDTKLVARNYFDLVLASVHPRIFDNNIDFEFYQKLLHKALDNPKTNIIAHIGYDMSECIFEYLNWDVICQKCVANKVAIEINLSNWRHQITILNASTDKINYDILLPILTNKKIMSVMKKYFAQGLKIAFNSDTHYEKMIADNMNVRYRYIFWRSCLKLVKHLNKIFAENNIQKENIVNCMEYHKLMKFLRKE